MAFSGGSRLKAAPEPRPDAVNLSVECGTGIGIDGNRDILARLHQIKLRFLKIGGDVNILRDERDQRLADLHIVAGLHGLVGHVAGNRAVRTVAYPS